MLHTGEREDAGFWDDTEYLRSQRDRCRVAWPAGSSQKLGWMIVPILLG